MFKPQFRNVLVVYVEGCRDVYYRRLVTRGRFVESAEGKGPFITNLPKSHAIYTSYNRARGLYIEISERGLFCTERASEVDKKFTIWHWAFIKGLHNKWSSSLAGKLSISWGFFPIQARQRSNVYVCSYMYVCMYLFKQQKTKTIDASLINIQLVSVKGVDM